MVSTPQKLDAFQDREPFNVARIGVWLLQRDGRVVFVCRAMWNWIETTREVK